MAIVYCEVSVKDYPDAVRYRGHFKSESAFVKWCVQKMGVGVYEVKCEVCPCHWHDGKLELGNAFSDISRRVEEHYENKYGTGHYHA